jgi:hypothetical protein
MRADIGENLTLHREAVAGAERVLYFRRAGLVSSTSLVQTTKLQDLFNIAAEMGAIVEPLRGTVISGLVTIPNGCRGIVGKGWDCVLQQAAAGPNLFKLNSVQRFRAEGFTCQGVSGDNDNSDNNAFDIDSSAGSPAIGDSAQFIFRDIRFRQWRYNGILTRYLEDLVVDSCWFDSCSHGLNVHESKAARITNNFFNASQLTELLSIAIAINTRNSTPSVHNEAVYIAGNVIKDRWGGESILVHDGKGVSILGNQIVNGLVGIQVQPGGSADHICEDVSIVGNNIVLTTESHTVDEASNSGIVLSGKSTTVRLRQCAVIGNTVRNANQMKNTAGEAGISVNGYEDGLTLQGNCVYNSKGVGIRLGGNAHYSMAIIGNVVEDVDTDVSGHRYGFLLKEGGSADGVIAGNYVDTADVGIYCDGEYSALRCYGNNFQGVTTRISVDTAKGANLGLVTPILTANFALSASWGSTATVDTISGWDPAGKFRVNSAGVGQAANPTVTLTFTDGSFGVAPRAVVSRNGGNQPAVLPTWTTSSTTLVITFPGTPVAGESYDFEFILHPENLV